MILLTSITSSTIISNLSGIFTLYFSWLFGIENVTKEKVIGLFICMCAVILIALKDKRSNIENNHSFTGDFLTLLGAAGYGLYTTILRIKVTDDETDFKNDWSSLVTSAAFLSIFASLSVVS